MFSTSESPQDAPPAPRVRGRWSRKRSPGAARCLRRSGRPRPNVLGSATVRTREFSWGEDMTCNITMVYYGNCFKKNDGL